jgi:hypothetical protein
MNPSSHSLSDAQVRLRQAVLYHGQLSADQARRLLYWQHTPRGSKTVVARHLKRLAVELGVLSRRMGIYPLETGTAQFIYAAPTSTREQANLHTLAISELYVRLCERSRRGGFEISAFDREPHCHIKIGNAELYPDAYCELRTPIRRARYFVEVDRDKEKRGQVVKQLRAYVSAFNEWDADRDGEYFPRVVFVVPEAWRKREVESWIKPLRHSHIFVVMAFDEAIDLLTRE